MFAAAGMAPLSVLMLWTVILVFFTSFLRKFNAWWYEPSRKSIAAPLPPGDLGWPVFGCMPSLLRAFKSSEPDNFTYSYIKKYGKTGVYKTHLFGAPTIMSVTPETNRAIYTNGDLYISGWPASFKSIVGETSVSVANGDDHRRLKRLTITSLQGARALSALTLQVAKEDVEELDNWASEGKEIKIYTAMNKLLFDRIVKILISCEKGLDLEDMANLYVHFEGALRSMPLYVPGTAYYRGYQMLCAKLGVSSNITSSLQARLLLDAKIMPIISRRRGGERKDDLLQSWVDKVDDNGQNLTDKELADMVVGYMLAGHKSAALALSWFMVFMNDHPHVLNKVRVEAQAVRDQKPQGELLTYDDIRRMTYLGHVLDETLRLVNVAPYNFRKASRTTTLNGFTVPKGWKVQTWPRAVHLNPDIYANPTVFNPDRWTDRNVKPGEFNPFSDGQRLCPGQHYAKVIMSTLAFYLVLDFSWEPINPTYEVGYLPFPRPKCGYAIKFTRRSSNHVS